MDIRYKIILFFLTLSLRLSNGFINWNLKKPATCVNASNYTRVELDKPIEVAIQLLITDVYDVNEQLMQFSLQVFLTEIWRDPAIDLSDINIKYAETLPQHARDCLWKPDVIFLSCKESKLFDATVPNVDLKVLPGKSIYQYRRYHLVVSCQMEFQFYPMDFQDCSLRLMFMSSRDTDAYLVWMKNSSNLEAKKMKSVYVFDHVGLQQFQMKQPTLSAKHVKFTSGNTSQLYCSFHFVRYLTSSMVNTYMPSFLVVCLSFVSFWLDKDAVPGRVTLGVTALLTLSTQMVSVRSSLPSVNYMTALDVWLFGCLLLVFMSLVEFVFANISARELIKIKQMSQVHLIGTKAFERRISAKPTIKTPFADISSKLKVNDIDKIARVIFPTTLIIFTIVYWIFFLKCSGRI